MTERNGPSEAGEVGAERDSAGGAERDSVGGAERDSGKREPRTGRVTGMRAQVRDANRISVYVDEVFSFGMPLDAALELGIRKDINLDQNLLEQCLAADGRYRARQRALGLLAHRPRSTFELRNRLLRAGFEPDAVDSATTRMRELGYLDDQAFASSFARHQMRNRGHARRRVLADLRKKGIDPATARRVVDELAEDLDESHEAIDQARRRLARMGRVDPEKIRRRLYAYLARRGFASPVIYRAIQEALSDLEKDP